MLCYLCGRARVDVPFTATQGLLAVADDAGRVHFGVGKIVGIGVVNLVLLAVNECPRAGGVPIVRNASTRQLKQMPKISNYAFAVWEVSDCT